MQIGALSTDDEVFIIAEIGNNHEGSYTLAEEMIGRAKDCGAHAVKFQTFKTELFVSRRDEARFKRLKGFELSFEQFEKLSGYAAKAGIIFFSTPLDIESAHFLGKIAPVIKIASGDNNFYPLIEAVCESGRPLIVSSGLADLDQIHATKTFVEDAWRKRGISQELAILHCVTNYPVPPEEANVSAITTLKSAFGGTIGYSDHTLGMRACLAAVALGARIIEKHFTINKNHSDFRDHKISADPAEMRLLVDEVRTVGVLLGTGEKLLQSGEASLKDAVRRSICAARNLPEGHVMTPSDIIWLRPSGGISPGNESEVIGRCAARALAEGEPIRSEDLVSG